MPVRNADGNFSAVRDSTVWFLRQVADDTQPQGWGDSQVVESTANWRLHRIDNHSLVWYCQIVRSRHLVFVPNPWYRAPNFGISRVTEVRDVFSVIPNEPLSTKQEFILMRWLLVGPWTAWGQGAGAKRTNPVIRGLALSAPPTTSRKGRRARQETEFITNDRSQWFQSILFPSWR